MINIFRFLLSFSKKKELYFVSELSDLHSLDLELAKNTIFGLDSEFDWRSTYLPKLSIIQISFVDKLFIIDCLKLNPEKILKKYLESNKILKIFHSARSDTTVLSKCLNIQTKNIFDIQIGDKLLSNGEIKSYGKLVYHFLGINLKKSETNSNWLKRPLTENQLNYAFDDVRHLIDIFKIQKKKLKNKNLFSMASELSNEEAALGNKSLIELRLKRQEKKFSKKIREIFIWREENAEARNIPPAYIFKDKYLKQLSDIKTNDLNAKKKVMRIIGDTSLTKKFISTFL